MKRHLELWGGPECTINRVRDTYQDQFERCGHYDRIDDLNLFADIGITTIRYPILWECIAPDRPGQHLWQGVDARIDRLRAHGIDVIAGLVHHGSGPSYTHLLDDDGFARGLADFAARVAERYSWINQWTPVNEPLTTARFSALYGHWYPHVRDEGAFWRALLNQIDGTRLAMQAIRRVNPAARLVQTEDLGRTFATAELREQAAFENIRRWATWDLLFGRVRRGHPLWRRMAAHGLEHRLEAIAADPCPPDIIGINHYLTSERFLDHRMQRYPAHAHGGNDGQRYADVEAIRVLEPPPPGLRGVIEEAWDRYATPIAVTEVHNGCTREEQLRWLTEAWDCAEDLRNEGVDVRAITLWSLLGSSGWNTLLTAPGIYEPGIFDVSSGTPRATALAALGTALATGAARHPLAAQPGWWRRPIRLEYPAVRRPAPAVQHRADSCRERAPMGRPLLIMGATGTLGQAFARACTLRNIPHVLTARHALDITSEASIGAALDRHDPWAVVNAAGWVRVDEAESHAARCFAANSDGPVRLARMAEERGLATLNVSSDLVFGGKAEGAYVETDAPDPRNVYGESKARMEEGLLALAGTHLIVRTAAFFSPHDEFNFAVAVARALTAGQPFEAAADQRITPTYVPHLVRVALDLLIDGEQGLWHLTNETELSWAEFAEAVADSLNLPRHLIRAVPGARLNQMAPRPSRVPLATGRGAHLPSLADALGEFARHEKRQQAVRELA